MVVSAILLTALAPITGALFGASYGTAIRIGYEIIFPALFGDMINDQKNKVSVSQEDGAKRTIKALHTMFTATGGASAMEFGIEQGIEMAKKKTESPDVQHMIDLDLGLTQGQLRRKGRTGKSDTFTEDPTKDVTDTSKVKNLKFPNDFQGMTESQILDLFKTAPRLELNTLLGLLGKEKGTRHPTYIRARKIHDERIKQKSTTQQAINKTSTGITNQIATAFNYVKLKLKVYSYRNNQGAQQTRKLIDAIKIYNRLVQRNRKPQLTIDSTKTLKNKRITI